MITVDDIKKAHIRIKPYIHMTPVLRSASLDEISHSKIIKILLQMPNLGNGIESLDDLEKNQYAWSRFSKDKFKNRQDIILINNDDIFSPWKLVLKK